MSGPDPRPALFLDRDGVINVDHGYVFRLEDFQFVDGIFDLASAAARQGYRLVVITNQSGIGRGYYSEKQFHELTDWMCAKFAEFGAPIDRVYFSPYHPTEGRGHYKQDHEYRKPRPGMLLAAKDELGIDMAASMLVGDSISDIQAGVSAGVGRNFWLRGDDEIAWPDIGCMKISALEDALPHLADPTLWRPVR